ncbi:hypothetical protein J4438_03700 [Candidatus Woesearchaeota archaeon]|nr:hypothetical protein [Candidatus Woesearchaeota archaeon]
MVQIRRRIHYNLGQASPDEDTVKWYFLIVNEPREIELIRNRIYQQLQEIHTRGTLSEGLVPQSGGIHYELIWLTTLLGEFPSNKYQSVYGGLWKRDRTLARLSPKTESKIETILRREGLTDVPKID